MPRNTIRSGANRQPHTTGLRECLDDYPDANLLPAAVDRIVLEEFTHGEGREASWRTYLEVVDDLAAAGAEGIVMGCTEIEMLLSQEDREVPMFDTTALHVERAVAYGRGKDDPE